MVKQIFLILIVLFVYNAVFNYPDYFGYNRDEACIQFANSIIQGENPYSELTENNEPITTGIFGFIAIPFVLLFGDIKIMTFIFWLLIIAKTYKQWYFPMFVVIFIASYLPFKTMVYRMDEFYFSTIFLFFNLNIVFLLAFILSRNWFVIPDGSLYLFFFKTGLLIPLILLALTNNGTMKKIIKYFKDLIELRYKRLYQLSYLSKRCKV